jgi:hypothetical protein
MIWRWVIIPVFADSAAAALRSARANLGFFLENLLAFSNTRA